MSNDFPDGFNGVMTVQGKLPVTQEWFHWYEIKDLLPDESDLETIYTVPTGYVLRILKMMVYCNASQITYCKLQQDNTCLFSMRYDMAGKADFPEGSIEIEAGKLVKRHINNDLPSSCRFSFTLIGKLVKI